MGLYIFKLINQTYSLNNNVYSKNDILAISGHHPTIYDIAITGCVVLLLLGSETDVIRAYAEVENLLCVSPVGAEFPLTDSVFLSDRQSHKDLYYPTISWS